VDRLITRRVALAGQVAKGGAPGVQGGAGGRHDEAAVQEVLNAEGCT